MAALAAVADADYLKLVVFTGKMYSSKVSSQPHFINTPVNLFEYSSQWNHILIDIQPFPRFLSHVDGGDSAFIYTGKLQRLSRPTATCLI